MSKKKIPIDYTARDFNTIKENLVNHAKRYYPDTYRDFNEASFGSLFMDSAAYIGDMLSFYLDYQANESFLDTAQEKQNVISLARTLGYNYSDSITSYGLCELYVILPAGPFGNAPDLLYAPVLKEGSTFASRDGGIYTLMEDVDFSHSQNLTVVSSVNDTTGAPEKFAVKAHGQVKSGNVEELFVNVGDFERFPRVRIEVDNLSEIVSIEDQEGHKYHEVPHLSQDVIYVPISNRGTHSESVPNIIKPYHVPRRFTTQNFEGFTEVQFGQGSDAEILSGSYLDPSNVVMRQFGQAHISDTYLDPTNFTSTEKMGIAPANTTLSIKIRKDNIENTNAGTRTVTRVVDANFEFKNEQKLDATKRADIITSLEVSNETPILGDLTTPDQDEIKIRSQQIFAAQDRAVTKNDYVSMIYAMPSKFGAIKRCCAVVDMDSFKRNINLYVISENSRGHLAETNISLKNNTKRWINMYKMMGDTFDILDAKVVNLGLEYSVVVHSEYNRLDAIAECNGVLERMFKDPPNIGEPLFLNDVYNELNNLDSVVDVTDVIIHNKVGNNYSDLSYNINANLTVDGRVLELPENFIYEFKFADIDFKGRVVS